MARMIETVATINSTIRTALALLLVGSIGAGGWYVYSLSQGQDSQLEEIQADLADAQRKLHEQEEQLEIKNGQLAEKDQVIAEKDKTIAEKDVAIDRLEIAMRLLKVDHRLARMTVISQETDEESGELFSTIRFVELNDQGDEIDQPRVFKIKGDIVYVDYWVVKFEDEYVEQADLLRSTSLCLFRRIFSEKQQPDKGFVLDQVGSRPTAYARGGKLTDFEKTIWDQFWNIANDPSKAKELGIRAAHGEAVSTRLQPGKQYRLDLRASGGLSIKPAEDVAPGGVAPST